MKKILLLFLFVTSICIGQITIKHSAYEIYFDTVIKQPIYTHYILKSNMLGGIVERTSFKPDPKIKKDKQGSAKDYKGSYYDKGHLAPNADFLLKTKWQEESMYYTNCAPQNPNLNRKVWKSLENYVRGLAKKYDVEIYTGCIYTGSQEYVGKLLVPKYYWKVIIYNGKTEVYLIPNITPTKKFTEYKINSSHSTQLIHK